MDQIDEIDGAEWADYISTIMSSNLDKAVVEIHNEKIHTAILRIEFVKHLLMRQSNGAEQVIEDHEWDDLEYDKSAFFEIPDYKREKTHLLIEDGSSKVIEKGSYLDCLAMFRTLSPYSYREHKSFTPITYTIITV